MSNDRDVSDGLDDFSDIELGESDFARGEPIPLDIIATELRRQTQPPPSRAAGQPRPDPVAQPADADVPMISTQELEQLIEEDAEPAPGERVGAAAPNPAARKSSDVLTDRLVQVRQKAETAERQRSESMAQNRELRHQVSSLREDMEHRFDDLAQTAGRVSSDEATALRRELEQLRSRASAELDSLRKKLLEVSQASDSSRNVELEAELQALRQEAAVLRHAVKEKDRVLEDLANQCRSLEDLVEDRDQEMEQLYRDLQQKDDSVPLARDSGQGGRHGSAAGGLDEDSSVLYGYREKANTEVLDGTSLIYLPGNRIGWKTMLMAALGGLLLGLLALEAFFLLSGRGELFSYLLQGATPTPVARAERPADATPPAPPQPLAATPAKPVTAAPSAPATTPARAPTRTAATTDTPAKPAPPSVQTLRERLSGGGEAPALVRVPTGNFTMGDPRAVLNSSATPTHDVEVPAFYLSKTEVTFDDYDRFARATGRPLPGDEGWGRGSQPVINVSWDDAVAYTRWLSRQTGQNYRLPSEAEWEYAARGGSDNRYWWGFSLQKGRAVCFDCGTRWDGRHPAPAGSLAANPFGLQDTAGNVMEWVQDCHNPNYQGAPDDGSAWVAGDCAQRAVRGGAYNKPSSSLRSHARAKMPRDTRLPILGFRVARDP